MGTTLWAKSAACAHDGSFSIFFILLLFVAAQSSPQNPSLVIVDGSAQLTWKLPESICGVPLLQMLVARSGAAAALVALAQFPSEELREAAAVALWDLCYDCPVGREAVVNAGG